MVKSLFSYMEIRKGVYRMSKFDEMIKSLQEANYEHKQQLLTYLLRVVKANISRLDNADRQAMLDYACAEVDVFLKDIPKAESYKQKDLIFGCEEQLLGLIMTLQQRVTDVPEIIRTKIEFLVKLVERERYVENALDEAFSKSPVEETDIRHLLFLVSQTEDEYQRGKLFAGLVYYRKSLSGLCETTKTMLRDHTAEEFRRWLSMGALQEDHVNALESAVDVARYFADDTMIGQLQDVLKLGYAYVNYFTVDTLLSLGQTVPEETVLALAKDLGYANLTYHAFVQHGKADLFPKEYATEEYLAKSDLVHWLMYPTELGQYPDEIEYIGKITYPFKKDAYHVFKYRSDSDTLSDDLKNQWLIGWSSQDGGTFSSFDRYSDHEKLTVSATLKNIKKKLIR